VVQERQAASDAERDAVPRRQVGDGAPVLRRLLDVKDHIYGEGKERMTWHDGTHELGRRIVKLLEEIVF
jgi:hypothetical protein